MGGNESEKFYMVANAYSNPGFPRCCLSHPPSTVYGSMSEAEEAALDMAKSCPKALFIILEAVASVQIEGDRAKWNELGKPQ